MLRLLQTLHGAVGWQGVGLSRWGPCLPLLQQLAHSTQHMDTHIQSMFLNQGSNSITGSWPCSQLRCGSSQSLPAYMVGLHNLRDNPGSKKLRIRLGRGDSGRRGSFSGRGMKGQKARGAPHMLYDGGQFGLIKFPVTRERPPYEVLYNQLGLSRLVEYIQLGLLDHTRVISMKDLHDSGCVTADINYGVLLYGKGVGLVGFPLHIQVTACDEDTRQAIEGAGGSVTRVYYTSEGLKGLLEPEVYTSRGLPLPLPAHSWHPKHEGKFEAVGQIRPGLPVQKVQQRRRQMPSSMQAIV
mmetsp:Transcript_15426/g.26684  ORF Transcript_15426/g.26684 Transcript_15426/m.26684 type:complete len:297 (+) Transcript_15426:64-954(+)